jgi:2-dehydropantoate 2-reductase
MRVAILGSGGVGGYFGGRLAAAGTDVTFVARGAHLAALRDRGLRVTSPHGNIDLRRITATDQTTSVGPVDVVFFTVKLYDTDSVLPTVEPLLRPGTLVISFQNGVDAVHTLTRALGREYVAGGTTYIVSSIAEPGVIHHGGLGRLLFGPLNDTQRPMLEQLYERCKAAGIDVTLSDRIMVEIWAKFVRLSAFSGMTAVTRCPVGPIYADSSLQAMMRAAVTESVAVARAREIPLPESVVDDIVTAVGAMPPESKSSMLGDLERGRRLELPWLSGAVVRIGEEVGVPTPTHRFIATVLAPHVNGTRQ